MEKFKPFIIPVALLVLIDQTVKIVISKVFMKCEFDIIANAMKSTIQKIQTTLMKPEVKKAGTEQIKKKAKSSIIEQLSRKKKEMAEREVSRTIPAKSKKQDMEL